MIFKSERETRIQKIATPGLHESAGYFDIRNEVSPDAWKGMETALRSAWNDNDTDGAANIAKCMTLIDPRRSPILSDTEWKKITTDFLELRSNGELTVHSAMRTASDIAILGRDRLARLGVRWRDLDQDITNSSFSDLDIIRYAMCAAFVSPRDRFNPSEAAWTSILDRFQQSREYLRNHQTGTATVIHFAAAIKIVDPARLIPITQDEWDAMIRFLHEMRDNHSWSHFAETAAYLRIIAAESIDISEEGIRIVDQSPLQDETRSPPLLRSI